MIAPPKPWPRKRLSDVVRPRNQKAIPNSLGELPFIGLEHVEPHSARISGRGSASKMKSAVALFEPGDVLYGRLRPYLNKVVRPDFPGCASAEFIVLPGNEQIDATFLHRLLMQPAFVEFASNINQGDRPRVDFQQIGQFDLGLPQLAEQLRIVAKLDNLFKHSENARENLARVPRLVQRLKRAILAAAFRGVLTADWRYHNPEIHHERHGHTQVLTTSFEPPFEIPTTWRWLALPDLGLLDRGRSRHRPRNAPELYGGPYPFVQTGDIKAARGNLNTFEQTYSEAGLVQSRIWPKGTVCITIAANIAESAILGIDACFPDSIVGFTAEPKRCDPRFIEFFIRSIKEDLAAFAPATAQKNINLETLRTVRVPCPPLEEQCEVVKEVQAAFQRIDKITSDTERSLSLLDRLDQATLAKAFRGELVP